jgi:hypothetical protein
VELLLHLRLLWLRTDLEELRLCTVGARGRRDDRRSKQRGGGPNVAVGPARRPMEGGEAAQRWAQHGDRRRAAGQRGEHRSSAATCRVVRRRTQRDDRWSRAGSGGARRLL